MEGHQEYARGGPVDVLTGVLPRRATMLILWKAREKAPRAG